jgi:SOS-response transcriptional repressor LexA
VTSTPRHSEAAFETVIEQHLLAHVRCVPLVPLKAAAGAFGDPQHVADDDVEWVEVDSERRLRPGMFVAQVVGRSMEPGIEDGSYCLFATSVTGSRQGRTVLVQLRDATDPATGHRYTVKRYESEKARAGDSWRHTKITLKPTNPAFAPIVLEDVEEAAVQVIAELVEPGKLPSPATSHVGAETASTRSASKQAQVLGVGRAFLAGSRGAGRSNQGFARSPSWLTTRTGTCRRPMMTDRTVTKRRPRRSWRGVRTSARTRCVHGHALCPLGRRYSISAAVTAGPTRRHC